jgi:hypothetical protein
VVVQEKAPGGEEAFKERHIVSQNFTPGGVSGLPGDHVVLVVESDVRCYTNTQMDIVLREQFHRDGRVFSSSGVDEDSVVRTVWFWVMIAACSGADVHHSAFHHSERLLIVSRFQFPGCNDCASNFGVCLTTLTTVRRPFLVCVQCWQ